MSQTCLLISMPQLKDPFFTKTITLVAEFNTDGAMGVILNRPLSVSLTHLLGEAVPAEQASQIRIFWGGPVQNDRGWVIHEDRSLADDSLEIEPGLYMTASLDALKKLLEMRGGPNAPRLRFFLGYAGWGPKQLEGEMAGSSWVTAPIDRDLIFDETYDTLWDRSLARIGVDPMALAAAPQAEAN